MHFRLKTPATIANLGPGFDCLGMAVTLYDYLEVWSDEDIKNCPFESLVDVQGVYTDVPIDENNMVYKLITKELGDKKVTFRIRSTNNIPHARGLGSSSAAICSALYASSLLEGSKIDKEALFQRALEIEGHGDNVAPCIFGGLVLVNTATNTPIFIKPIKNLHLQVHIGKLPTTTKSARNALPEKVDYQIAVKNCQSIARLMLAFTMPTSQSSNNLLLSGTKDYLHQNFRRELYPESLARVEKMRLAKVPAVIAGAGSSVLGFWFEGLEDSDEIDNIHAGLWTPADNANFTIQNMHISNGIELIESFAS